MRKFILPIILAVTAIIAMPFAMHTLAEDGADSGAVSIPEDTLITYGYLEQYKEEIKEELKQEILDSLLSGTGYAYNDISATAGQMIILSPNSEIIYRGGGAVAITSSDIEGEGITDMSAQTELFSGQALEYGHIYFASDTASVKAVLVTGDTAYFTVRGDYEIG